MANEKSTMTVSKSGEAEKAKALGELSEIGFERLMRLEGLKSGNCICPNGGAGVGPTIDPEIVA